MSKLTDQFESKQSTDFYLTNYLWTDPMLLVSGTKVFLGDKTNRVCRFCGSDESDATFRLQAHAIPELLGNKSIFTYYECDDCNRFFGSGIENEMGNWTKPGRTFARIRGKSGVPSIKRDRHQQRWRIDHDASGFHIKNIEGRSIFTVDEEKRQLRVDLSRDVFTPVAVLKAFVKTALTLFPSEELPNFQEALSWIRDPDHTKPFVSQIPFFYTFQPGPLHSDLIWFMLMRRKECVTDLPYALLVLRIANFMYQVFLPSPVRDRAIHEKSLDVPPFPTLGGPDPLKYGKPRVHLIDLCGKHPVRGETVPITLAFDHIEIKS